MVSTFNGGNESLNSEIVKSQFKIIIFKVIMMGKCNDNIFLFYQVCAKTFGRRDRMERHFQTHFKNKSLSESIFEYQQQMNNVTEEDANDADEVIADELITCEV